MVRKFGDDPFLIVGPFLAVSVVWVQLLKQFGSHTL